MSAPDRKAELERKKARLAAIRAEKNEKDREKEKDRDLGTSLSSSLGASVRGETAEDILKTLGISNIRESPQSASSSPRHAPSTVDPMVSIKTTPSASPKPQRRLQLGKLMHTDMPPKDQVSYAKFTQTSADAILERARLQYDQAGRAHEEEEDEEGLTKDQLQKMPLVGLVPAAITAADEHAGRDDLQGHELTEEEKANIMISDDFLRFFDRTTRILERALESPMDIFIDYSGADREDEGDQTSRQLLKFNRDFFDDRWSRHRTVTCLDWSSNFPELLLAAYHTNEESPHEPDGVCLIWNLKYRRNTPEYIFHCQSTVVSATLAKFHPNLVLGGTYSGQIVLWDVRTNKRTPVQRSPLSANAHTHPIHSVTVAGTQNAHNLISLSSDGRLCSWSLDMLSHPQESIDLQHKQSKAVASTCFSFFANDVNNFVVGAEDGTVYTGLRHGSKAGIIEAFESHVGPVTSVDTHNIPGGPIDFSHLFLSSALDWTVKLWSTREQRPLYSFEDGSDYVADAAWSPVHPAMFATVDITGRLDVWSLNKDAELPTARVTTESQVALNKCRWHMSGLHIATGDDAGRIRVYDVNEAMACPRSDEWSVFAHTINELRTTTADQHEDQRA